MHHVRILCGAEVACGFSLAGFAALAVAGPEDGVAELRHLAADPGVAVILVEERIYHALPEEVRRSIGAHSLPMVLSFPSPTWGDAASVAESYIVEMLRLAIGYRVRLG